MVRAAPHSSSPPPPAPFSPFPPPLSSSSAKSAGTRTICSSEGGVAVELQRGGHVKNDAMGGGKRRGGGVKTKHAFAETVHAILIAERGEVTFGPSRHRCIVMKHAPPFHGQPQWMLVSGIFRGLLSEQFQP